jgi:chitinase
VTGQEVSFNAASDGSGPLTYEWDFGDGTTASGQSVNHTFAAAGEYTVVLTVSNECGTFTVSYTITVNNPLYSVYLPMITTIP